MWYLCGNGLCDGSVFGDAGKLIVSRKGTVNWYVNVTLGSRTPKYENGASPLCKSTLFWHSGYRDVCLLEPACTPPTGFIDQYKPGVEGEKLSLLA